MTTFAAVISGLAIAFLAAALVVFRRNRLSKSTERLLNLLEHEIELKGDDEESEIDWARSTNALKSISDRLGKAGFFTPQERRRAKILAGVIGVGIMLFAGYIGLLRSGTTGLLIGLVIGFYLATIALLFVIRFRSRDFQREVTFQIPLVLEALILLVESGLGILPAIEKLVAVQDKNNRRNPVLRIFRLVYELASHGMPFGQALEVVADAADLKVLRHVLLHLDISGSEGGELVPSLRSLSDHSHTEWKLSVEHRVKRLENAVVFPVFASVMGLMCLTAAVPIVSLLEFSDTLQTPRKTSLPSMSNVDR